MLGQSCFMIGPFELDIHCFKKVKIVMKFSNAYVVLIRIHSIYF